MRVPVVSKEGKPLMPTKPSRARKWLREGKAVKRWSDLGERLIPPHTANAECGVSEEA